MPRIDLAQSRRGTAAQWTSANPVLASGEIGVETDTLKLKVGNGSTAWNSLAYVGGSGGGDASTNTAVSVDSELALFSGTGGKTFKRATGTGIPKLTSGVQSIATPGVDYVSPTGALGVPSSGTLTNCTGLVPSTGLAASGTPSGTTYLRGDGAWATPSGGGGGTGDASTNTSVSVDSELVLFSGTGGKTLKRATGTGIVKATSGVGTFASAGADYTSPAGVENLSFKTLSNCTIQTRIAPITSSATPTFTLASTDEVHITAQAVPITSMTSGVTVGATGSSHPIMVRIKDNGTARAIVWGALWRGIGVTLPTTTVAGKTMYVGGKYNTADSVIDVLAVGQEA